MRAKSMGAILIAGALALPLIGCNGSDEVAALPQPREPTATSVAYFCSMNLLEHAGPRGQAFLKDKAEPIWFSSVRDTFAFTMLPEEPKDIAAIYVNDFARARDWRNPEPGTWVEIHSAWFVLGSDYRAGMGEIEIVAFSDRAAAQTFAAAHDGRVVPFSGVKDDDVLQADNVASTGQSHTR
jgi:copper chaperone NosL